MPLTITLQRAASDQARAFAGDQVLGSFEPRALLIEHPLHPTQPAGPVAYGRRLWAALGGEALAALLQDVPLAPDPDSLIAIRTDDAELAGIPWEYLHRADRDDAFLIFDYLLVREVPVSAALLPRSPDPALSWRLVAQGSDPLLQAVRDPETGEQGVIPVPRLQVLRELDALAAHVTARQPAPPIRWQRIAPTRAALIDLATGEPILLHYAGHGAIERGQPILCFDNGAGLLDAQPVRDLAQDLRGRVYLAFLNACRTADVAEPGANLALGLVKNGVPVVLGSQYSVIDDLAVTFAWTFYQHLAAGAHPAVALFQARRRLRATYRDDPRQWAIPALYSAAGYAWPRQRPIAPPEPRAIPMPLLDTLALQAPDHLLGRAVELVELATLFVQAGRQIVTICGAGGMGKTALAHALAARLRFHFTDGIYALTLALPGDQTLLAAAVRRQVAELLGVAGSKVFEDPHAAEAQEQALVQAAQGRKLLIFDNYETVLWRLGSETDDLPPPAGAADAQQEQPPETAERAKLYWKLITHFNGEELRTLCFAIGVDYDVLAGQEKRGKARELIMYCERTGQLPNLIDGMARARAGRWPGGAHAVRRGRRGAAPCDTAGEGRSLSAVHYPPVAG